MFTCGFQSSACLQANRACHLPVMQMQKQQQANNHARTLTAEETLPSQANFCSNEWSRSGSKLINAPAAPQRFFGQVAQLHAYLWNIKMAKYCSDSKGCQQNSTDVQLLEVRTFATTKRLKCAFAFTLPPVPLCAMFLLMLSLVDHKYER